MLCLRCVGLARLDSEAQADEANRTATARQNTYSQPTRTVLPATEIVPSRLRIPFWKAVHVNSEENSEPASDIDAAAMDNLKALDPLEKTGSAMAALKAAG
jgi:hypothetical protein